MVPHPMALPALLLFAGPADFPGGTIAAERGGKEWTIRFADDGKFTAASDGSSTPAGSIRCRSLQILPCFERDRERMTHKCV